MDEITPPPNSADICYIIVTTANICIDEKDYDEVMFFINKEEWNSAIVNKVPTFDYPFMVNLFNLTLSRFPELKTKLSFYENIRELTKKDIYNRIPTDLRRYVYSNDKNYNGVI